MDERYTNDSAIFRYLLKADLFREKVMNARSFIAIFAACLYAETSTAAEQFVCNFGDRVKFDSAKLKNPTAKIVPKSDRYTFILGKSGKATYIPTDGVAGQAVVHTNDIVVTFIEDNQSSNLFVVTIFTNRPKPPYKAVYTLHASPDNDPFFWPHTSLGECERFER